MAPEEWFLRGFFIGDPPEKAARSSDMMRSCLALLLVSSLVACSETPKPAPAPVKAEAPAVDPDANLTPSQKLALAKLPGTGSAALEVATAQM